MTLKPSAAATLSLLFASACATAPPPPPPSPAPGQAFSATSDVKPRVRQDKIIDLLSGGDVAPAKTEAQALVSEQPDNREARTLLAEIEQDPQTLLGSLNFDVTVKSGDTFASLAERYLHDRGLAYALARYNKLNPPNQAAVGQVVQIPGSPPREREGESDTPARRREPAEPRAPRPAADRPAAVRPLADKPASKPAPEPAPEKPAPPRPAPEKPAPAQVAPPKPAPHDPAKAASLRSDALVLMNKGDIDHAVGLLRQAAVLDPDSLPIKGDLDRALRIQHGAH